MAAKILSSGHHRSDDPDIDRAASGDSCHFSPLPDRPVPGSPVPASFTAPAFTLVGVVGDIHFNALDRAPRLEVDVPLGHEPWPLLNGVARGPASATVLQSAARDAVRQVDSDQAFGRLQPLDELVDQSLADRRQAMELLAMVAGLALVPAVTGINGVLAHAVAARTRELGIRMALGATAVRVLQDIVRQAMLPVLGGLVLGLGAALAVARLLRRFLFGVHPQDPRT
jgi:putative ABC transport system permease protein